MTTRILIIDSNPLTAENLRFRLAAFGQVDLLAKESDLTSKLSDGWDVVISDWSLGGLEGAALFGKLAAPGRALFLYTENAEVVDGGAWRGLGVRNGFTHLRRADLVLAVEQALSTVTVSRSGGPLSFLLVEDSATVRQFVKTVLADSFPGSELLEAADGRTALAAMKNNRVNLIVTDLQMPGMDGLSFVQLLRNNAVLKKKPVLVLSGAVTEEAKASLAALEKISVLAKPVKPEALVSAVKNLLL
ncbi:MAG TPA: response regulator [bacterium]|jgi:two-component system chemotaxis response regulator CheY|nr:response regulator [bacterium]